MKTEVKKKIDAIQMTRALAVFGVLSVHCSNTGTVETSSSSFLYILYNFFNIFGKYGTPTFILLSSFVLFYNYFNKPLTKELITRFYSKRLLYVLVPYLIFSLIYYTNTVYNSDESYSWGFLIGDFFNKLLIGKAYTHLYFIFVSVQLYLAFPFCLYLFKKYEFFRKYSLIFGFVLQWLWVFINSQFIHYERTGSVGLSYLMYYFAGAFFGIYYGQTVNWFKNWRKNFVYIVLIFFGYLISVILHVGLYYAERANRIDFSNFSFELAWSTQAMLGAVVILFLGHVIWEFGGNKIKNFLIGISNVSFGIYLVHPLFLFYLRENLPAGTPLIFHSYQIFSFFVTLFGSWVVVWLTFKYVPFSWILFGQKPRMKISKKKTDKKIENNESEITIPTFGKITNE